MQEISTVKKFALTSGVLQEFGSPLLVFHDLLTSLTCNAFSYPNDLDIHTYIHRSITTQDDVLRLQHNSVLLLIGLL